MKHIQPILIIGTQRSGSNLLRLMLNQFSEIEAPHPPHLLPVFSPLLPHYGDLNREEAFHKLVLDVCRYVEVNPVPWSNIVLDRQTVINRCRSKTLIEIFKVIYELKAEASKAVYWCCKSMANVHFISEIESGGIHPFYIHLIRDGRDVAASFENTLVGEKHIYFIAQQWKRDQDAAITMTRKFAPERTITVRYETFIRNPKSALEPVINRLNLTWNNDVLNFYLSEEAKRTAASGEMWRNVIKPVDNTNMRHYSERLTKEEILIFERVAGDTLQLLGYELDNKEVAQYGSFTTEELESFHRNNVQLKAAARLKYVKDAEVRVAQEKIIDEIRNECRV